MVGVEVLGQLGQIVRAARLIDVGSGGVGGHAHHLLVRLTEHLAIAHATHGVAVTALHQVPEVVGDVPVVRVGVGTIGAQRTHNHGDVLVGVAVADGVDAARQRLVEGR